MTLKVAPMCAKAHIIGISEKVSITTNNNKVSESDEKLRNCAGARCISLLLYFDWLIPGARYEKKKHT